ncbi:MAG: 6-bladed beta-propeller [Candidatus Thiodiazotropha sp. (ex Lucinoma borealis)]|nr:6-bladed beta-propeller [Candidatus Thiodiazotropha sp. (ex Lucinoma borealis)]MCU7868591.1 6-bladed beta-propeller [Candidatus Thiodiazotropha sp. (ex Lucinoma borealis)]
MNHHNFEARSIPLFVPGQIIFTLLTLLFLGGCTSSPELKDIGPIAFPNPPDAPRFYYERTVYGTGAVKSSSKSDLLRKLLTGSSEREGYAFAKPFDVAVHRGRVFVSDTVQRVVYGLDFVTGNSLIIGDNGDEGDLFKPLGLATDDQGTLFVCDIQLKKVMVYDRDGNWLYSIDLDDNMSRPSGIDISGDGRRLYVVDIGGVESTQHGIAIYDTLTRTHIRNIGIRGTATGEFNLPRDVSLGRDGYLYITDSGNFRIQVLDQEGNPLHTWGSPGRHLGQFTRPKGIASDNEGNLYVVDAAFGNFQLFSSQGELLLHIGTRSEIAGPAKYMLPAGIDVDEDGRIYVLDQFFRKMDVFRPASLKERERTSDIDTTRLPSKTR